jgi:PAS domain S-box-containing protein
MTLVKATVLEALIRSNKKAEALEQQAHDLASSVETVRQQTLAQSNERIEALEQKARDLAGFVETARQQILLQSDKKTEALEQKARALADFVEALRNQTRLQSEKEIEALGEKARELARFVESVRKETRLQFETEIIAMGQKARDLAVSVETVREMTLLQSDSEIAMLGQSHEKTVAMNEALIIGAVRQHELTEVAENLNTQLQTEITERKWAEDKVRVSEVRYRRLFEAAHDGVLLLDPGTRKITDANPFMTKLLGYRHDQLVGKELFEIGLLKDEAASQEMFRKLKRKHEVRYEDLPLESQRGQHQEVEVVANLYKENGRSVIQCNIRDITARKQAEEILRRSEVLAASNRKLEAEMVRRQAVEDALKQTKRHQSQLLQQSRLMQEQLRQLSRQVLRAQEEERKRISRELHDVIAQTLTGINIRLATLKKEAGSNTDGFDRNIEKTQLLVGKSVDIVHRFARELRPAVLDDLGLIPALHSFMKDFAARTGVHTRLTAFARVEKLDIAKRTVLFRVAQEALTNVARHAHASRVEVSLQKLPDCICMKIKDDGKSFHVQPILLAGESKRLGLLGMRERAEMIGGTFGVESTPGQGTTIQVEIPFTRAGGGAKKIADKFRKK